MDKTRPDPYLLGDMGNGAFTSLQSQMITQGFGSTAIATTGGIRLCKGPVTTVTAKSSLHEEKTYRV